MGVLALVGLAVAGPVQAQSTSSEGAGAESSANSANYQSDTVVARVGELTITLGEVIAFRQTLPEQFQQLPDEVLLESILTQMIDQTLLESAALESGLDKRAAFRLALRNQRRAVMADAFMTETIVDQVTDDAIQQMYVERFVNAEPVPEVRSSHILVEDEAEATDLKAKLDAGADFAALAAKHSVDPTASRGGERGWQALSQMVPDYADAVHDAPEGEVIGPVSTPFGWHLIRVEGKRNRPVPQRVLVENILVRQLSKEVEARTLKDLQEAAQIERLIDGLPADAVRADTLLD